jgi:hypothetical protein
MLKAADVKHRTLREEHAKILSWLSPLQFWSRQQSILAKREPETGQWLIDSKEFVAWRDGASRWIMLTGIRASVPNALIVSCC